MSNEPKKKSTLTRMPGSLDYVLDVLRYAESSDTSGIRSRGKDENGNLTYASTGYGYYQITKATLDDINKQAVADGLKPLTLNSREEQHEAGRRLVLEYDRYLRNNLGIKNPTLEDYYGVHFKGKQGYKDLLNADKSSSISKHVSQDEMKANPSVLKGTVGDVMKILSTKVDKAKAAIKKESSDRRAIIQKEKKGYDTGTFTPVDLRQGSYKGDGKESWDYNAIFPNGKKLGQHNMDYVIEVGEGNAKILKRGESKVSDVKGAYTVNEYDYTQNFYDPNMDAPVSSGGSGKNNGKNYELDGFENYGGNAGFGTKLAPIDEVRNGQAEEVQYQSMNDGQIAKLNATRFKGDNFHTAQGNMGDMYMQEINGKQVNMDSPEALKASMDSSQNYAQQQFINEMAAMGQRKQFKLGGDITNNIPGTQESNQGLISFNEGGTHEENPLGGIPQNTNPDGSKNTVEEGETKHQNYVFSDTLQILPREAEELMLPEEIEGMTYAEASKFLNQILEENENDPIIKRTVDKQLDNLKLGNEKARIAYEADEMGNTQQPEIIPNENTEMVNQIAQEDMMVDPDQSLIGQEQVSQPVQSTPVQGNQNIQLDPEMMNPKDENEMLLGSDAVQQPQFRLGGNMFNEGGDLLWGPTPNGEQYLREADNNQLRTTYNLDSAMNNLSTGLNTVQGVAGEYGSAASGVVSGALGMKEAFSLKDKIEAGEKIDKGQVALKGAAAGATIGGSVGSVVPVIGTAIGTAVGAVAGGAAGLITGSKAAKKADIRRMQLDDQEFGKQHADYRTASGNIEGDTKEFSNGGPLDPPDNRFIIDNLASPNYLQNSFNFGNGVANTIASSNNELPEIVIDNQTPKKVNYQIPNFVDQLLPKDMVQNTPVTKSSPVKKEDNSDKKLLLDGENFLRYAPIAGLLEDRNRIKNTNFTENYVHSGERFVPKELDENTLVNTAMIAGRNMNNLLQANSGGNASAARANMLANGMNVSKSLGDIYQKVLEYNNAQNLQANTVNNALLKDRDAIVNAEEIANANNRQSQFELERNADLRIYQALGDLGKERTLINQTRNATGYDQFGRKIQRKYY